MSIMATKCFETADVYDQATQKILLRQHPRFKNHVSGEIDPCILYFDEDALWSGLIENDKLYSDERLISTKHLQTLLTKNANPRLT